MFKVIEYARMMVGTKAIATLSTGYLNALDYAKTRVQGADLTQMMDKSSPRVTITHHPDVRRSLMLQKSYAEGLRALVAYTAYWQDLVVMGQAGDTNVDLDMAEGMNNLLLPIIKGVGSERSYEMLAESLQTFGGSGLVHNPECTCEQWTDQNTRTWQPCRQCILAICREAASQVQYETGGPSLEADRVRETLYQQLTCMQLKGHVYNGVVDAFRTILRDEGPRGFYTNFRAKRLNHSFRKSATFLIRTEGVRSKV